MIKNKSARALIISCVILIISSVILTGCEFTEFPVLSGIGGQIGAHPDGLYIDGVKAEIIEPERETEAFKNLSEDEQMIYKSAYTALRGIKNEFAIYGVDYDRYLTVYGNALFAFLRDYPEFFWLNGYVEANAEFQEGSSIGNVMISLGIYDYWKDNDVAKAAAELDAEVQKIADAAREYITDFERVKYVHDTIILGVEYDVASFELGDKVTIEAEAKSNTAYGALTNGTALCGGYASAFMLIMQELGIKCEFITGEADGGPHAWNMIELDGEYYHIDLTWDDLDGTQHEVIYNYFCLNDDQILKNHVSYNENESLSADATKYNYHIYNNLYLEDYSFDTVNKMAESYDGSGMLSIKCASIEVLENLVDEIVTDSKIYDIAAFSSIDSYQYMLDDEMLVLTLLFD